MSKIYFDGKIDLGNILTLLAIIIAFSTLITRVKSLKISEQSLNTKVENLQNIVDQLDKAKLERLNLQIKDLNDQQETSESVSKIWESMTDNNAALREIISQQIFELSVLNREGIAILYSSKIPSKKDKKRLDKLILINEITLYANNLVDSNTENVMNFSKTYSPNIDSLDSQEYISQIKLYLPKLKNFKDSLLEDLSLKIDSLSIMKSKLWDEYTALD